jgi:hypothetical protein
MSLRGVRLFSRDRLLGWSAKRDRSMPSPIACPSAGEDGQRGDMILRAIELATTSPDPPPSPPGDKPPLFPPRERAIPGHEYSLLLQIPDNLGPDERQAHLLAVRGLMHARQARHDAAGQAFAHALALNPRLDLAGLPTFWDLPRAGCEAAVNAYLHQGLTAEATTLNARLRQTLRPRPLPNSGNPRLRRAQ